MKLNDRDNDSQNEDQKYATMDSYLEGIRVGDFETTNFHSPAHPNHQYHHQHKDERSGSKNH